MKALIPLKIEPSDLSINIEESDYEEYSPTKAYALKERVKVGARHEVFESLENNNQGNAPLEGSNSEKWAYVGLTNPYKLIDKKTHTQTLQSEGDLVMELSAAHCHALALLNVDCARLKVELYREDSLIFSQEERGFQRFTSGWYSFFFGERVRRKNFLFSHPLTTNARYKITLKGERVRVGVLLRGKLERLGEMVASPSDGFDDFSKYSEDEWGETKLKEGVFRDWLRGEMLLPTPLYGKVKEFLRSRRGKLTLYIPTSAEDMMIYGYAKAPELILGNGAYSSCTIDIQGVS